MASLVVSDDLGDVPMAEVMRVLAPGGVAYIRTGGAWQKTIKPQPDDIDDWTHYLHDATGNAVAADKRAAPPKWAKKIPRRARAMVLAADRLFMAAPPTSSPKTIPTPPSKDAKAPAYG